MALAIHWDLVATDGGFNLSADVVRNRNSRKQVRAHLQDLPVIGKFYYETETTPRLIVQSEDRQYHVQLDQLTPRASKVFNQIPFVTDNNVKPLLIHIPLRPDPVPVITKDGGVPNLDLAA